jgi:ethanolaminephosphotransferase
MMQASKLIMAHMAKEPYNVTFWQVAVLCTHLVVSRLNLLPGSVMAWGLATIMMAGYLHYVFLTVDQICRFLDINCLTIKHTNGQHHH